MKPIKKELRNLNKPQKIALIMTIIGAGILLVSTVLLIGTGYFQAVAIIAVMLTGLPYTFYKYWEYRKIRSIEKYLPDYLRDVSEAIDSGLTLTQALTSSTKGSYGVLSTEMERTANQISWGVSFEDAMMKFINRNPSYLTKKAIMVIIESQKSGGDIAKALRTVATDIKSVGRMKKQRESKLKVYTYSIYFIFFLFLGIIVVLTISFVPATPDLNRAAGIVGGTPTDLSPMDFQNYFFHLALIQAFFAGLIGGQMGKGSILEGVKHSIVMILVTVVIFQFFLAPPAFENSMAEGIIRIAPGAVDEETGHAVYTIDETTNSEKIAEIVRRKAEEDDITELIDISSEDITFVAMDCQPCVDNKLAVSQHEVEVRESTSVGARVKSLPDGRFQIILGEAPMDTGAQTGAPI